MAVHNGIFSPKNEAQWRKEWIEENHKYFTIANLTFQLIIKIAYNSTYKLDGTTNDGKLKLLSALFSRNVSAFQSCMILLECGLTIEAEILLRSCLENIFLLAALHIEGNEIVERLFQEGRSGKWDVLNALTKSSAYKEMINGDSAQTIQNYLQNNKIDNRKAKSNFCDLARRGNLSDLYVIYKDLSITAAHPTTASLSRLTENQNGEDCIVCGPNIDKIDFSRAISFLINMMFGSCSIYLDATSISKFNEELENLYREWINLAE